MTDDKKQNKGDNSEVSATEQNAVQEAIRNDILNRQIDTGGNADAKILLQAFREFAVGGLTLSERDRIEKIDNILPNADIVIGNAGDKATIAQENGRTFAIKPVVKTR